MTICNMTIFLKNLSYFTKKIWLKKNLWATLPLECRRPGRKGVDTLGGLPPPQALPGGVMPKRLWLILLMSFQVKLNHFTPMNFGRIWKIFPADVLPRKHVHNSSDRRRHLKYLQVFGSIWKNFMITRKILPTSFRENLNKNSRIEVVMWSVRDFSANM